jgi:hypothetical protein
MLGALAHDHALTCLCETGRDREPTDPGSDHDDVRDRCGVLATL